MSHIHRHGSGDIYMQPSPTTFLPHHPTTHPYSYPQGGGDATVIAHNPLLATLFAVGYSQGGGHCRLLHAPLTASHDMQ